MPGQAQPQYRSRIEQVDPDGQASQPLLDDARYPGPAPDGSRFAFVRSTDRGAGIFVHSLADGSDEDARAAVGGTHEGEARAVGRSTDRGAGIFVHSLADGSDAELVP